MFTSYEDRTKPSNYFPPELKALLAVAQQVTPSGQPTVAAQIANAAQQSAAPQGIAGALQQSQQAAPSVAQNMQEQQAAQIAQAAAQGMQQAPQPNMQPPQAMSGGGIAGLPIVVGEYAEGGVIGYATGDLVEDPEETTSIAGDWARELGKKISPFLEKQILANKLRSSAATLEPGIFEQMRSGVKDKWISEKDSRLSQASQMEAMLNALQNSRDPQPEPNRRSVETPPQPAPSTPSFQLREGSNPRTLIRQLTAELNDSSTSPAAREAIGQKIQELMAQVPDVPPSREMSSTGIGSLPTPEPLQQVTRPTAAAAQALVAGLTPSQDQSTSQRLFAMMEQAQKDRPDIEEARAKALRDAYGQETSGRELERLIRFANATAQRGLGGMGTESLAYQSDTNARDAAYQAGMIALQEAKAARKEGNIEKLMAANEKMDLAKREYDKLTAEGNRAGLSSLTSQYVTDAQAQVAELRALNGIVKTNDPIKVWNELRDDVDRQIKNYLDNNFKAKRDIGNDPAKYLELTKTFMKNAVAQAQATGRYVPPEALAFLGLDGSSAPAVRTVKLNP